MATCACARPAPLLAPVVVPFEIRGDLIVVDATVNGLPAKLILDSGTGAGLALDSTFAVQSHIEMSAQRAEMSGNGGSIPLGTAHAAGLGAAPLANVLTVVVDIGVLQDRIGHDVHGTIGYDLFNRYVVAIDYDAHTITLTEPAAFTYAGTGTVIPLRIEHHLPVLDASIVTRKHGTIPVTLHADIGSATYAVRLSSRVAAAHDLAADTITVQGPFGVGVGGASQGDLLRLPALRLGPLVIARPSTALSHEATGPFAATAPTDGTIGAPVFRRMHVIFDYSRSQLILEPRGRLDLPDTVDASGLTLAARDSVAHTWRIADVVAGSAGAGAGIQSGDELVAIDGQPAAALSRDRVRELLRSDGVIRHLTVRRGTTTREVAVRLRMII